MRLEQKLARRLLSISRYSTIVLIAFFVSSLAVYTYTRVSGGSDKVYAATSSALNFQGRLYSSSGKVVSDGYYNLEFKLYDGGTQGGPAGTGQANAGSLLWTEDWYDSNGVTAGNDNRVKVVNGYFTVNLGSQTVFPNTVKWDQELWLTMNVGGATQTASPTYDGEMLSPGSARTKLTATPYSFRSSQAQKLLDEQLSGTGTLDFLTLTANRSIKLPDQDGTLCIQKSSDCVDVATTNSTATTSSNSGLEISSDGLRLLGGCSDGQILKWDNTLKTWICSTDNGSPLNVRESDGTPANTGVGTLEFGPATNSSDEFVITDEGGGVTRVRLGTTVLTTSNYATTLDTTYVNTAESPSAGDITGSFSAGLTIGANSVALGTDTTGNYVDSLGTLTGLSVTGNTGEGSTPALTVLYGSTSNTAVQGNTQVTCASGSGNLTGGGTVITLGSGGTCAAISTNNAVTFSTSVTTPVLTNSGGLTINTDATAGVDDVIFQAAGTEKLRLLENGDLKFEKGSNDVTFTVDTPSGSPATYTFTGASGTVLTSANFTSGGLDTTYVNTTESPAAGDITGSFSAGLTIGANSVALGTDTTGNYVDSLGTLTGLSVTGNTGEGSTPALSVLYGSTSNTAVQGNTQITCASGSGNLTGGGTVITLGSGGTCAAISTNNAVTFSTSVTTPVLTNSGNISLNAVSASDTTVSIGNSGAGITNLDLTDGGLYVAGTSILTSGKALNNLTGITSSGTVTLSSLTAGGIVKAGSGGGLSLASAGADYEVPLTFSNGLTRTSNSVKLGGNLTGATTIGLNSNNLSITGTGTSAINAASGGGLEILADTSAALAVRNSAGTVTYFNVSASGNIVQIGSSSANSNAILFALNSYNGASDPGGAVNGASYYSTTQNADRCYENSYWSDCMTTRSQADSTLGSAAASISLTLASSSETALICNLQVTGRSTNNTIWLRLNNASAAGSYAYNVMQNLTGANNNTTQQSSASATQIPLNGNSSSTNPGSYTININNFSTINKSIDWTGTGSDPTNTIPNLFKGSATYYNSTSSITSVQFLASTGNLNAGTRAWCQAR